jgi:APA family basic amino acid/polyamine antiporter
MSEDAAAPRRTLGLTTATTIIVGSMIGSGILLLPADMLAKLPSPPLVMAVFVAAAVLTAVGALTVAELSGMFPKAGGQYVYLREAFGPFPAYLFGWTTFWVVQTGTIAAVAAAFARILARFVDLPGAATPLVLGGWSTGLTLPPYGQAFVAIALILLLTFVNYLGVRFGGLVSNVSTIAKAAGLLAVVVIVLAFAHPPSGAFGPAQAVHQPGDPNGTAGTPFSGGEIVAGFSTALMLILFAYDGWYSATYVAAEMRNPRRDVPLSLILGPLATTAIYLLVAGACLYAVSLTDALHLGASEYLAGRAVKDAIGEGGAIFVSLLALVSIFGTTNAYVLTAPRIAYAQAKDGLFMRSMGRLDPKRGTPAYGSLLCGLWACLLVMTGLYDQLVASVVFAVFLFHVLTAAAHLRLRRTQPGAERPFRTPGGPTIPVVFLVTSLFVVVATLALPDYRVQALLELAIIALGIPAYLLARRRAARAPAPPAADA